LSSTHILHLVFFVLAIANGLGIAVMLGLARKPVRLNAGLHIWRRYRKLWRELKWSLLSVSITNIQGQGMALMVAAFAGPAAYAPIAATLVMFAPLRIISSAFANMIHPEMAGLLARRDLPRIRRLMRNWPAPLALFGIVYGVGVMVALPMIQPVDREHDHLYQLAIIAWVMCSIPMLYVLPRIWLEVTLDYRSIAVLSVLAAVVGLALVLAILLTTAPSWALLGGAVSELIVLIGTWSLVLRRQRSLARQFAFEDSTQG